MPLKCEIWIPLLKSYPEKVASKVSVDSRKPSKPSVDKAVRSQIRFAQLNDHSNSFRQFDTASSVWNTEYVMGNHDGQLWWLVEVIQELR